MEQISYTKSSYLSPCMELQCVDLRGLLLTDASINGKSLDKGDTKDLGEEEVYQGYIHAGAKQRGLWDDPNAE